MADRNDSTSNSSNGSSTLSREPGKLDRQDSIEFFDPLEHPPGSESDPLPHPLPHPLLPPLSTELDSYSPDLSKHHPPAKTKDKKEKRTLSRMFRRHKKPKENQVEAVSIGTHETKQRFSEQKKIRSVASISPSHQRSRSCNVSASLSNESEESFDGKRINSEDDLVATLVNPSRASSNHNRSQTFSQQDSLLVPSERKPDSSASELSGMESDRTDNQGPYQVLIKLHSGHDLAIRDRSGSSDPYVKIKCGWFKHVSSTVYHNLNPVWNETFTFNVPDLVDPLTVRVFDHDFVSQDDYMGGQSLHLEPYNTSNLHIVDLGLEDPTASQRGEMLGSIRLSLRVTPVSKLSQLDFKENNKSRQSQSKDIQLWSSVATVILLDGSDLPPMDSNGLCDPYCKFKLGTQKYKSKAIPKTLNPKWMDRFDLRVYNNTSTILHIEMWDRDYPKSDDFIGKCSVDLSKLEKEVTHNLTLQLQDAEGNAESTTESRGNVHFLISISGVSSPDPKPTESTDLSAVAKKYNLLKTLNLKRKKDVGFLRVKIDCAENLSVIDTFALVELRNTYRRTQTVYRTHDPVWNRTFDFDIHDIHDELELMILKETRVLGRVKIPLHRLHSGVRVPYALKANNSLERAKGVVYIECVVMYNPLRAAIRTINPREHKLLEAEEKFSRKVLMKNIGRVSQLVRTIMAILEFIKSLWSWEDHFKSAAAFIVFLISCLFGELWMLMLVGCFVFAYHYMVMYVRKRHLWQIQREGSSLRVSESVDSLTSEDASDLSDLGENVEPTKEKRNLRTKLRQLQEVLLIVQKVLGCIGDMEERIRNLFNWSVPFLCWMAISVFLLGAVLFYFVPLRLVILVWGINKFSKRLRNPNYIPNNELVDFISRSPTNKQLEEWQTLSIDGPPSKTKGGTCNKRKATTRSSPRQRSHTSSAGTKKN